MSIRTTIQAALAALLLILVPVSAYAAMDMGKSVKAGDLEISGAFARATLPSAPTGGGYLTIVNTGTTADKLVSATSPTAGAVTLHATNMEGSVMKMRDLPEGIDIPAGGTVVLEPSGLHMMFEHLKQPFVEGKTVPVTLTFAKAGTVAIDLDVLGIAAKAPMAGMAM
jgi:copper(I)-binding protein